MTDEKLKELISSPDRIIYPKQKITKLEVAKFYNDISPFMLPYIKDRLLSVIRCHENINHECFFKKHPTSEGKDITIKKVGGDDYFSLNNSLSLLKQIQLGTIEFHIWGSKITSLNSPDMMVFDLDPDKNLSLSTLRKGTLELKNTLLELGLNPLIKTSGGKGYHIIVFIGKKMSWEKFSNTSKQIALLQESKLPNLFTTNIRKINRQGKIYIDFGRNTKGATCVAPFSLRAREGAKVSVPILWDHLYKFAPDHFSMKSALTYTKQFSPWKARNLKTRVDKLLSK